MVANASQPHKPDAPGDQVLSGQLPAPRASFAFREAVAACATALRAQSPQLTGRITSAVQIVLAGDLVPADHGTYVVGSQSDAGLNYVVDGECECQDADRAGLDGWCKHRLAVALHKRAVPLAKEKLAALDAGATGEPPVVDQTWDEVEAAGKPFNPKEPNPMHPQPPDLPPLPEAPASANTYVTLLGRQVQVTLRDHDEDRLLARMAALLARYPVAADGGPEPPEGWCSIHGVQMTPQHNAKGSWWSHKTADGWCKGRA